jgi:hypothetical protein
MMMMSNYGVSSFDDDDVSIVVELVLMMVIYQYQ